MPMMFQTKRSWISIFAPIPPGIAIPIVANNGDVRHIFLGVKFGERIDVLS